MQILTGQKWCKRQHRQSICHARLTCGAFFFGVQALWRSANVKNFVS